MTTVHIHAPRPVEESCNIDYCPTCERPRRMFVAYYEWYGANVTCAGCGETWNDGYRAARGVVANLKARGGIKWELEKVDEETRVEIVRALAEIIRVAQKEES